jgi:hypothetical protein
VFFKHGFNWSAVNYAPLVTAGIIGVVTIWFGVSARKWFKGPIRTVDLGDIGVGQGEIALPDVAQSP